MCASSRQHILGMLSDPAIIAPPMHDTASLDVIFEIARTRSWSPTSNILSHVDLGLSFAGGKDEAIGAVAVGGGETKDGGNNVGNGNNNNNTNGDDSAPEDSTAALDLLWALMQDDSGVTDAVATAARRHIVTALHWTYAHLRSLRQPLLQRCLATLGNGDGSGSGDGGGDGSSGGGIGGGEAVEEVAVVELL